MPFKNGKIDLAVSYLSSVARSNHRKLRSSSKRGAYDVFYRISKVL
jgi:hypothetical protein